MLLESRGSVCCAHSQIFFWELDTELHSQPSQYHSPAQTKSDQVSLLIVPIPSPYRPPQHLLHRTASLCENAQEQLFSKYFSLSLWQRDTTFFFWNHPTTHGILILGIVYLSVRCLYNYYPYTKIRWVVPQELIFASWRQYHPLEQAYLILHHCLCASHVGHTHLLLDFIYD